MKSWNNNRIARMLARQNLKVEKIYGGPISTWLIFAFLIVVMLLEFAMVWPWIIYVSLGLYVIGYFFAAYSCNSFAINSTDLYIVNPNFPFRRIKSISLGEIQFARFYVDRKQWKLIFLLQEINCVEIQTRDRLFKIPCFGLEEDNPDVVFSPNTIDELEYDLSKQGVPVNSEM